MVPMFIIGALILRSVGDVIDDDIAQVWQSAAARSEALYERRQGNSRPAARARRRGRLRRAARCCTTSTSNVKEGEIVALLGTNGAGKSTLLKAISGVVEADRGAIVLDGRDITHAPPNEIAALGIVQMPGGKGVFGSLTVQENLDLAGWTNRRDPDGVKAAIAEVLEMFPILGERLDSPAANLSRRPAADARPRRWLHHAAEGAADRRAVARPRAGDRRQLLPIVQRMADDGVTVVLVEQSVNVALTVAERAYFMERGEIRFSGPTAELLERPDLLRSVFLAGGDELDRRRRGSPARTRADVRPAGRRRARSSPWTGCRSPSAASARSTT